MSNPITKEAFAEFSKHFAEYEAPEEPVAWGVFEGNLHDMFFSKEEALHMANLKGTHAKVKPLYTSPKRPWVGLTDEDRLELAKAQHSWEELCLAVEAKLKEKNT